MNKLISFDPGETSGWAILNTETFTLIDSGATKFTYKQLYDFLTEQAPDQILYETFLLYEHKALAQKGSTFYTVEMIGIIKLYAQQNYIPINTQTAQVGKQIWKDNHLEHFGYLNKNRHANDAIRHALHYMKVHREPNIRKEWNNA